MFTPTQLSGDLLLRFIFVICLLSVNKEYLEYECRAVAMMIAIYRAVLR